jgi:hypothetical protein
MNQSEIQAERERYGREYAISDLTSAHPTSALFRAPYRISLDRSGAIHRATFRRLRAVFRLERIFCGPVGHFALWKPPRYFSASKSERLVTARRNQVGKCVRVFPVIEAPRELVHVERQIFFVDLVVRADDSALEQAPEALDCVCVSGPHHVLAPTVAHHAMRQRIAEQAVSCILIGGDQLHVFGNGLANETIQRCGIGVLDNPRDNHSLPSDSADHRDFACPASANMLALAGVFVFFFAADESLVHFHFASQRHHVALHRSAPAMADVPRGAPVSSRILTEDHAPDLQRAETLFHSPHQVPDLKPNPQRDFCVLEDRMSGHAETVARTAATIFVAASPAERSLERIDLFFPLTARASHAIGPALSDDVGFADFIGRKRFVELFVSHHASDISGNARDCQ